MYMATVHGFLEPEAQLLEEYLPSQLALKAERSIIMLVK